jgi:hypothetical protein
MCETVGKTEQRMIKTLNKALKRSGSQFMFRSINADHRTFDFDIYLIYYDCSVKTAGKAGSIRSKSRSDKGVNFNVEQTATLRQNITTQTSWPVALKKSLPYVDPSGYGKWNTQGKSGIPECDIYPSQFV